MSAALRERRELEALARRCRIELQRDFSALRRELLVAGVLRALALRAAPLLPYAATTAGIALLVMLLRRHGAPPALVLGGAAIDALRVWSLFRNGRSGPSPLSRTSVGGRRA